MLQCLDSFSTTFTDFDAMIGYHERQSKNSRWEKAEVKSLQVAPLDKASPLIGSLSRFAPGISEDAVNDTAKNLGLALKFDGKYYPVRSTAFKSLADRAKIGGSALPKLGKPKLAGVLNSCLELHNAFDGTAKTSLKA